MLTINQFNNIRNGLVFAKGEIVDSPDGINMSNSGEMLKWVAVKGYAEDWCIYIHFAHLGFYFVESQGDKVCMKENIQTLVPCDDEVFNSYRY